MRWQHGIVFWALGFGPVVWSSALPRFSLQKGQGCVLCHVNPSGGGPRNAYGADVFGARELPAKTGKALEGQLTNGFRVGGDYRALLYFYNDQYPTSSSRTYGFFTMQADLYATAQLGETFRLTYVQDVLRGQPEVFGVKTYREGKISVKAGSFLPNVGLRHDDHTAVTRGGSVRLPSPDGLLWKPKYVDTGVEVVFHGFFPGEWTAGVFNGDGISRLGPDDRGDNSKAVLTRGEWYGKLGAMYGLLGGNLYRNKNPDLNVPLLIAGGFGGLGTDTWTLMGEGNYVKNLFPSARNAAKGAPSFAFYSEATFRLERGVYVTGRVEYFDPDWDVKSGHVLRLTGGMEIVPLPGVEFKPFVRFQSDTRSDEKGNPEVFEVLLQSHWWF